MNKKAYNIADATHPEYLMYYPEWNKFRTIKDGGDDFVEAYLEQFSNREEDDDFTLRKSITPIPGFATAAITDIKNAIFQRMADIARRDGSVTYQAAIKGQLGGIDLEGSTMNHFISRRVLDEMLFLGKVGVYVDMPTLSTNQTLVDTKNIHPYVYIYKAEEIRNWTMKCTDGNREFEKLLLEETVIEAGNQYGLPEDETTRYRLLSAEDGIVTVRFFNTESTQIDIYGEPSDEIYELNIPKIPFVLFELNRSPLRDIANHQIALLNLESSDIGYALLANYPFYTEQRDLMTGSHLKGSENREDLDESLDVNVGATQGRIYPKNVDRPGFIHPSSEPITASMEKQKNLKDDIRMLVQLALSAIRPKFASAEAKMMDERGLESGLSFIGLVLEHGERQLAKIYDYYERTNNIATIHYPERYSLKTERERLQEVDAYDSFKTTIPSQTFQRLVAKRQVEILMGSQLSNEELDQIYEEIDAATYTTSDPETLRSDLEAGLISPELASEARGYPDGEVEKAAKAHAERILRIKEAQSNEGARGIKDEDTGQDAKKEKQTTQNADLQDNARKAVRGKGGT